MAWLYVTRSDCARLLPNHQFVNWKQTQFYATCGIFKKYSSLSEITPWIIMQTCTNIKALRCDMLEKIKAPLSQEGKTTMTLYGKKLLMNTEIKLLMINITHHNSDKQQSVAKLATIKQIVSLFKYHSLGLHFTFLSRYTIRNVNLNTFHWDHILLFYQGIQSGMLI